MNSEQNLPPQRWGADDHEPGEHDALDAVDAELMHLLAGALAAHDPMPADLVAESKFAMTVAQLQAEVAQWHEEAAENAMLVRSTYARASSLSFTGGEFTVMISVTELSPGKIRIDGWLVGGTAEIELRSRTASERRSVDAQGRFTFDDIERGLVQFVVFSTHAATRPVITPMLEL